MATEAVVRVTRWTRRVLVVAVLTAVLFAFAPLVATETCFDGDDGESGCSSGRSTLIAEEGAGILALGLVPALLAVPAVLRPSFRIVTATAVVLTLLVFVAGSVGLLVIPTAVVAWIAAVASAEGGRGVAG